MTTIEVREGDCVEVLAAMPEHSIDAVVCDPPYGLEFMGKEWDRLDGVGDVRQPGDETFQAADKSQPFGRVRHGGAPSYRSTGAGVVEDPADVGGFQDGAGGNPFSRSRIRYGNTSGGGTVQEVNDTEWDGREDSFPFGGGGQRVRYGSGGQAMQEWHGAWLAEALRVLKPGGWLLAFSGTRTYHRLACAAEDAGFEVRDMIDWLYGSGFPKSMDVAKAIDSHLGVDGSFGGPKSDAHAGWIERGRMRAPADVTEGHEGWRHPWEDDPEAVDRNAREYVPGSPEAAAWAGWGTALKPGHEPILVARKPIERSVAATVLAHGTGALNIDASRIAVPDRAQYEANFVPWQTHERGDDGVMATGSPTGMNRPGRLGVSAVGSGRFPANVILSHDEACEQVGWRDVPTGTAVTRNLPDEGASQGNVPIGPRTQRGPDISYGTGGLEPVPEYRCVPGCPVAELDAQSGEQAPKAGRTGKRGGNGFGFYDDAVSAAGTGTWPDDPGGGASRFFYVAKTSTRERNLGLAGFPEVFAPTMGNGIGEREHDPDDPRSYARNHHPTVKPVELMRYLVRMVTPPGGTVCDPFLGSGTTAIACVLEGFGCIGIEREPEYVTIAKARIEHARQSPRSWEADAAPAPKVRTKGDGWEQGAML